MDDFIKIKIIDKIIDGIDNNQRVEINEHLIGDPNTHGEGYYGLQLSLKSIYAVVKIETDGFKADNFQDKFALIWYSLDQLDESFKTEYMKG